LGTIVQKVENKGEEVANPCSAEAEGETIKAYPRKGGDPRRKVKERKSRGTAGGGPPLGQMANGEGET